MRVCCTKALLEFLEVVPAEKTETELLFSFSANLLTINRKKCIAVVNDATGCGFVLYGVTAKEKKNIQKLISDGIVNMLKSENYSDEVISEYIAECDFPAAICKTSDRSAVARLNKFCERIKHYKYCYQPDDKFQTILLPIINDEIITSVSGGKKDMVLTFEESERLFRERYGKIYGCRAGVFDVTLNLKTPCVRRVTIPLDFSLFYLHDVIQELFLWKNYHLHDFILQMTKGGKIKQRAALLSQFEDEFSMYSCEMFDEEEILLQDIFPKTDHIFYEYDFGDEWVHEIRLIKIIDDADIVAPVCEKIVGDAPPEDCGGSLGFSELQRVLKDPKDPRYWEMREWCREMNYYQKNIVWINSNLRRRYLAGAWHLYYRFTYSDDE